MKRNLPLTLSLSIGALMTLVVTGWSFAQEETRTEREKAAINQAAGEVARDYLETRRTLGEPAIDIAKIMADAERFSSEARDMRDGVMTRLAANGELGAASSFISEDGKIDASALAFAAGDIARASRDEGAAGPLFVTFVSLSMPDAALTSIIRDTKVAGGVVVVRGFYGGSYGAFSNRVRELFEEGDEVGISVDPRYFQAVGVKTVPTYAVVVGEPVCDGFICDPIRADTLSGNISVGAALQLLADKGELAPLQAKAALARLDRGS
jgi:type-F conjugative transfer system pilin assembly protein TrbC